MDPRLSTALLAGRAAGALSRRLGKGGGTVIAGHVVPRLAPSALRRVTLQLAMGSVVVSGTNGKTTTTRLISHILSEAGHVPLHNRAGANMLTGLYSAVVEGTDLSGRPRGDVGVFEVDEATLPQALKQIRPRALLLHNIFRDQLDRYGEVHFVAHLWKEAVARLPADTQVLLNADDPLVAWLAQMALGRRVLTYGLEDARLGQATLPHAADARLCPQCSAALTYARVFYGHLGWYRCESCGFQRPSPDVRAREVQLEGDSGARLVVETPEGNVEARLPLPGLYNVENALAAVAACLTLGVSLDAIQRGLESFHGAFGRLERISVEERELFLALVKNPVGFTEVLRMILTTPGERTLVLVINDLFADGTDVSWLWDVEFEQLEGRVNVAVCAGLRAEDMAVRLKYAGVDTENIRVENDARRALEMALEAAEPGETIYVLPTYTAMLAVRDVLRATGYVKGFWED